MSRSATTPTAEQNVHDLLDGNAVVLRLERLTGRARRRVRRGRTAPRHTGRCSCWTTTATAAAVHIPAGTDNVTDPPTNAEIDAAVGVGPPSPQAPTGARGG
jgi:hypothetical protein